MGIHKKNKPKYTHSYVGAHTSITPNILTGIEYMHELGATAMQIFTGPSQSSSLRVKQHVPEPEVIKNYLSRNNIKLVIHAIYTLNFCSAPATSKRIKYAQDNLIYDLELAEKIGACCVVVHIGSQGVLDSETAYSNMASNVKAILHATATSAPNIKLALEVPAGQGKQIASNLADLTRLWMLCIKDLEITHKRRLGICIDTAHLFSSGQDIRTIDQLKGYLRAFDSAIGKEHLFCIHLNDSKVPLSSRRDVHQGIGEGYLFGKSPMPDALKVIQELVKFAKTLAIPVILETHSAGSPDKPGGELYAQELALLKQLGNANSIPKPFKTWKLIHSSPLKLSNSKTKKVKASQNTIRNIVKESIMHDLPGIIHNTGLINKLGRIKDFYKNIQPDKFRALAYNKAIISLQSYPEEILQGAQVAHLPSVGAKMVEKINEWLQTGDMKIFAEEKIDSRFAEWEQSQKENISHVLGFGPAKVRLLAKQGITTITQLREAVKTTTIKLSPSELIGLKYHDDLTQLVPREEAKDMFETINSALSKSGLLNKYGLRAELAGSWPSGKAASKDIDVLLFTDKYPDADKASKIPMSIMTDVEACLRDTGILLATVSIGAGKLMGIVQGKREIAHHIDIRLLPSGAEVFGRFYFTSGRVFNQMVRAHAKQRGYKLNEFGLYDLRKAGTRVQGLDSEEKVMSYIGLKYIPMNKRR
jgi:apurinic endonuclease APN1